MIMHPERVSRTQIKARELRLSSKRLIKKSTLTPIILGTGLWIVAPINRAVDDKAAKSLLGESFKRQLKYDGKFSRITFICSKTDDISSE